MMGSMIRRRRLSGILRGSVPLERTAWEESSGNARQESMAAHEGSAIGRAAARATPGYFCKEGAHSGKEQVRCDGPLLPRGSFEPTPVTSGYWTISGGPLTRANQSICPAEYFCSIGIGKCPKGRFGATAGLDSKGAHPHARQDRTAPSRPRSRRFVLQGGLAVPTVFLLLRSGPCSAGWYCPIGSTSSQQESVAAKTYIALWAPRRQCQRTRDTLPWTEQ